MPVVSAFPPAWGFFLGLGLWLIQLLWGSRLVRVLLGMGSGKREDGFDVVDAGCPFLFVLDGRLVVSKGAEELMHTEAGAEAARLIREAWPLYLSRFYSGLLAVPCVLRAVEAVTADYGRLRFAQGPLWQFGRFLGVLAGWLERPLRWGTEELRKSAGIKAFADEFLLYPLAHASKVPAWMENLDVLSPVSFSEAKRTGAWELGLISGKDSVPGMPPEPPAAAVGTWFPWLLFCVMSLWALRGGGLWGAPAFFLGLGYIVKIRCEYDFKSKKEPLAAPVQLKFRRRYEYCSIEGRALREHTPGLDDTWIEVCLKNEAAAADGTNSEASGSAGLSKDAVFSENGGPALTEEVQLSGSAAVSSGRAGTASGKAGAASGRAGFEYLPREGCIWIRLDGGIGWKAAESENVKVRGWLCCEDFGLTAESMTAGSGIFRRFPVFWRLLLPRFLTWAGLAWSVLQIVGI